MRPMGPVMPMTPASPAPQVDRRRFLSGGALAAAGAVMLAVSSQPVAASGPTAASPATTRPVSEDALLVGPAAVVSGATVVRVAFGGWITDALSQASLIGDSGTLVDSARLMSLARGRALAPVQLPAGLSSTSPQPDLTELYLAFEAVDDLDAVDLLLPGVQLVEQVPVVPAQDTPFAVA